MLYQFVLYPIANLTAPCRELFL